MDSLLFLRVVWRNGCVWEQSFELSDDLVGAHCEVAAENVDLVVVELRFVCREFVVELNAVEVTERWSLTGVDSIINLLFSDAQFGESLVII